MISAFGAAQRYIGPGQNVIRFGFTPIGNAPGEGIHKQVYTVATWKPYIIFGWAGEIGPPPPSTTLPPHKQMLVVVGMRPLAPL